MKPDLVFISHRIPWPPDKGEKIRAFNVLRHLSERYRIHLGCLTMDAEEAAQLPALREWCASVAGFAADKRWQKISALARFRPGRPLMLDYYRHPGLLRWAWQVSPAGVVYVYTVAMMPYLDVLPARPAAVVLDAVDVDSEKWTTYAETAAFPMRHVWAREGRTLLAYERAAMGRADATLFVSPQETARFQELAPEAAGRIFAVENGVDLARFAPGLGLESPYEAAGPHIVFTGTMDYWPNADAVIWFATEVMPLLRAASPQAEFHVVGAGPGPDVMALARLPGVSVTGRVPDVRPYVAHADVAVAPLRIARGIQNKVLEAMAMGKPVVASPQAHEGVRAVAGRDLLVADGAPATVAAIQQVLAGAHPDMGAAARAAMEAGYAWGATLGRLDEILSHLQPAA